MEINIEDFGSRFGHEDDDEYDDEADPFNAIFDDDDIV